MREWFCTIADITERRERTDALREADRQKNVFLAMLAHELRNPLAPIRNSIEIVRRVAAALPVAQAPQSESIRIVATAIDKWSARSVRWPDWWMTFWMSAASAAGRSRCTSSGLI